MGRVGILHLERKNSKGHEPIVLWKLHDQEASEVIHTLFYNGDSKPHTWSIFDQKYHLPRYQPYIPQDDLYPCSGTVCSRYVYLNLSFHPRYEIALKYHCHLSVLDKTGILHNLTLR